MKFGDVVLYEEMNKLYTATVLGVRVLDDHSGEDDESLLHLGFFKEVTQPGPNGIPVPKTVIGTSAQDGLVQFRLDVAHESHTYTAAQQLKYGVAVYPGGRWQEINNAPSNFRGTQSVEDEKTPADKVKLQKTADTAQAAATDAKIDALDAPAETKAAADKVAQDEQAKADVAQGKATGSKGIQ
jgi:hypothetical protein